METYNTSSIMPVNENDIQRERWRRFGWTWLDGSANNGVMAVLSALQETPPARPATANATDKLPPLPLSFRLVVLWVELVALAGAAFLLLQLSWITGSVVASVCESVGCLHDKIVAKSVECFATVGGLLTLMGWFFNQRKVDVAAALLGWRRVCYGLVLGYFALHLGLLLVVVKVERLQVESAHKLPFDQPGLQIETGLKALLLAPLVEELTFRGLAFQVVLNRTASVRAAISTSSVLFALLHLANLRKVLESESVTGVVLQVCLALTVGVLLSVRVSASGSLFECLLLHAINNLFAVRMASQFGGNVDVTRLDHFLLGALPCLFEIERAFGMI